MTNQKPGQKCEPLIRWMDYWIEDVALYDFLSKFIAYFLVLLQKKRRIWGGEIYLNTAIEVCSNALLLNCAMLEPRHMSSSIPPVDPARWLPPIPFMLQFICCNWWCCCWFCCCCCCCCCWPTPLLFPPGCCWCAWEEGEEDPLWGGVPGDPKPFVSPGELSGDPVGVTKVNYLLE